jgi:hypothetical protein
VRVAEEQVGNMSAAISTPNNKHVDICRGKIKIKIK